MIDLAVEAAPTVQGEAVSIGPAVEADSVIWTAKLRTGRVVTFLASVSKDFRAAALIAPVAAVDSVVVIASVAGDLVAVGLAVLADLVGAVVFGVVGGAENKCSEFPNFISRKAQSTN
jgi:hypothetical protein